MKKFLLFFLMMFAFWNIEAQITASGDICTGQTFNATGNLVNGKPEYQAATSPTLFIRWSGARWEILNTGGAPPVYYHNDSNTPTPPCTSCVGCDPWVDDAGCTLGGATPLTIAGASCEPNPPAVCDLTITTCPAAFSVVSCDLADITPTSALAHSPGATVITSGQFTTEGGAFTTSNTITSITYQDAVVGNCPKTVTRTFTLNDDCPDVASCNQTITLSDPANHTTITTSGDICIGAQTFDQTGVMVNGKPEYQALGGANHLYIRWSLTEWQIVNDNTGDVFFVNTTDTPTPPCSANFAWSAGPNGGACNTITVAGADCSSTAPPVCDLMITACPAAFSEVSCDLADITPTSALAYSAGAATITQGQFTTEGGTITTSNTITSITYQDAVVGNCPKTVTRTFTVVDDCPATKQCTQTITLDDPTQNTLITTAGDLCVGSQTFDQTGNIVNGKPEYQALGGATSLFIRWSGSQWEIINAGDVLFVIAENTPTPPCSGDFTWVAGPQGGACGTITVGGPDCSPAVPELDVRNNADDADITNGSNIRSVALGTEYGSVCVGGGTASSTFRAENNGGGVLTLGADALAITNTTDFTITTDLTNNGTIAAGGVATFTIQFHPMTSGTRTCTVTIRSDDADEDPYTFLIGGFGVNEPTVAAAGPAQTLCGTSTNLAANTPTVGTGLWTIIAGNGNGYFDGSPASTTSTTPNALFNGTAGQTYTLRWTIANAPCTASTSDVNITFVGNPTTAAAGADQNVCGTSTFLGGNTPVVGTGMWSVISGAGGSFGNDSSPTSTFSGTAGTSYILRWTISNNPCTPSFDDVTITLFDNPTAAAAGADQNICGTSTTLAGNTPTVGTGTWNIILSDGNGYFDGGTLASNNPSALYNGTQGQSYTLRWTTSNAPCPNSTDDVVITFVQDPTPAAAGADQAQCTNGNFVMNANTPTIGTGSWSEVGGPTPGLSIVSANSPNTSVSGVPVGSSVTLRWTISNAPCTASTSDVVLTNNAPATTASAGPNQTMVCNGDGATMAANTPSVGTGLWSEVTAFGVSIASPNDPNTTVSNLPANNMATLRWTITNGACSSSSDVDITTITCCPSSVTVGANPAGDLCLGTTGVQYNATIPDGTGPFTYAWCAYNNGTGSGTCFNGFSDNTAPAPTRNWTSSPGQKSVGVTVSQAGCPDITDIYSFNVVKPAAPTPATTMKMFCHGDPNITPNLASTGVNVGNTLTGNERIVWELVSAPANSDLTPGLLNGDCMGSPTGTFDGELRIANASKVVRVDNVSVVNNLNQPIIGDYVFRAYLKDCDLDCISDAAGPFTITVKDPFPMITCPADMTVECGSSIDPMDTGNPTAPTNSCCMMAPNITHIDASAPGMCPVVEVITRTFTVDYTDCGYMPTCNQTITIEDNIPPTIMCPSDQTIEWPVGFNTTPVGANTPQDPSIDPSITGVPMADDGCGLGEVPTNCTTIAGPVTNLNFDALGLISTSFAINGVAPIPPTATCVHEVCITVHMVADIGGIGFEQSNIRDEAGNVIGQNGNSNGDCNPAGAYSTMCIPVAAYNTYAADGTLSFSIDTDGDIDNICATSTIQASVEICSACGPGLTYQDVITGPTPANCPNLWVVERTWTVVDQCGTPATCVQTFTFTDTTPPVVNTCSPDPAPIEWPVGFNTNPVGPNTPQDPSIDPSNYPNIVYSDNCAVVSVGYQDVITGPTPGNCPNLWTVERTWTVTDACGLTGNCVQTFTFTDTTPPTLANCPADPAPIEWPAGFNTAAVGPDTPQDPSIAPAIYGMPTASDNCGTPTISYQDVLFGPVPGDCPNLWTLQRTWTATDACGLTATCVQVFTFTDTTPPAITTCPPPVAIEGCGTDDISGNGHPPYSTVLVGTEAEFAGSGGVASDNCAIVAWNYVDVASGTCPTTVTRTWTLTDACGLTATCTQVFTIDDTTPPVVTCQDISVSLGANGTYNLQPTEVLASTSDNCGGAVTPVSVSPSVFDCQSFPNNTVTLTVEDACGNPGTCTANVYVAPFITNVLGVHTNETCAGANDGTITASATAGGGQVMYSVDGVNFQPVGSFNNLAPGLQTLTIKVFGVASTCVETLVFDIQPGGPLLVCYADSDNDGYGSALMPPVTTCNCPAGYKTAAQLSGNTNNDCNDNNALINPGAAEICDGLDNNCDGIVPASEADADGDGYRVCDNDCDDNNPAINPGAVEICNGIDDNCNGMIDEGLGGLTYNGNVYFSTQAQVDAWPPCYSVINGSVTIVGVGINNLGPLSNIVDITGGLTIQSTGLTSMSGLDGLAHVGGTVTVYFNSSLTTLNGLEALNAVGGSLYLYYNFQLSDCCAISDLVSGGVSGAMIVFFNKIGCNSVTEIITICPTNPLIGNPNTGIGTQAATGATYSKVGTAAVSVYPNPVRSVLTVNIAAEVLSGTMQVTDVTGRTRAIVELVDGQSSYNVDVSQFSVGLYFVTVKTDGAEPVVKRFVVE